jgi:Holliday junction resolvase RusA-like endonuclease
MITLFVKGIPVAKARARTTIVNGRAWSYTPKKTMVWEDVVRMEAKIFEKDKFSKDIPLIVTMQVLLPVPKSFSRIKREMALDNKLRPTTRPDLDNYIKSCLDAMNGILYEDDSQVVEYGSGTGKFYSETPGIKIQIDKKLDNGKESNSIVSNESQKETEMLF